MLLAGAVSHELRAKLGLISGYSQSLLGLSLDEATRRRYLQRILTATDTLTELADEILDLAVPAHGGPALRRRPVSLEWLVDQAVHQVGRGVDTATVHYQGPGHVLFVDVDPTWIGHVLCNLIANALRHGNGPTGVTTIRARQLDGFAVVSVCDDGAGFQPDERDLVFDPLYQGRRARAEGVDGAGLGLYLCRALVEAHGGRIWVDDTSEGGSVSFSLPLHRVPQAVAERVPRGLKRALAAGG
jgi:signal transduction histidine kinase